MHLILSGLSGKLERYQRKVLLTGVILFIHCLGLSSDSATNTGIEKVFPSEDKIEKTIILIKLGEFQEAIFDLEQKLDSSSQNPAVYFYLGKAYKGINNNEKALFYFNKAIEIAPDYPKPYVAVAIIKGKEKKFKEALELLNTSISFYPDYPMAYINRGVIKGALGDNSGAIDDFGKSIELNPLLDASYVNRGISYEVSGRLNEACLDWERAKNLGNKNAKRWLDSECKDMNGAELVRQMRLIKTLENQNEQLGSKLDNLTDQFTSLTYINSQNNKLENKLDDLNSKITNLVSNNKNIPLRKNNSNKKIIIRENIRLIILLIAILIAFFIIRYRNSLNLYFTNKINSSKSNSSALKLKINHPNFRGDIQKLSKSLKIFLNSIIEFILNLNSYIYRSCSYMLNGLKMFFVDKLSFRKTSPLVETEIVKETIFENSIKNKKYKNWVNKFSFLKR